MAMVYKDMINSLAWHSYDVIQNLIGYYYLHNADGMNKLEFVKDTSSIVYNFPYLEIPDGKRDITLEEYRKYTVELYKPAIYDECTIIESVHDFYMWGPIKTELHYDLDIEIIKSMDKEKLYNFISDYFNWIYENRLSEKHDLIEKINELEKKYCSDISVLIKVDISKELNKDADTNID